MENHTLTAFYSYPQHAPHPCIPYYQHSYLVFVFQITYSSHIVNMTVSLPLLENKSFKTRNFVHYSICSTKNKAWDIARAQ